MAINPLTLIPAAAQAGFGIYQGIQGRKLSRSMDRPVFDIPEEVMQNLDDAQIQALEGLPAEQKQAFIENVQRGMQAGLSGASTRKAGLSALPGLVQNQMDAYKGLLSQDAAARQANQRQLMQQRDVVADYRNRQFEINQMQPYQATMAAAEAMKGAGIQNIFGGLDTGIGQFLDYQKYKDMLGTSQGGGQPGMGGVAPNSGAIQQAGNLDTVTGYNQAINSSASQLPQINL